MSKWKMSGNNKKVIALLLGGAFVASSVGGNVYADNKLQAFYNKKDNSAFKFTKVDYKVGTFSGDVQWEAEIVLDPCDPKKNIIVKGQDHVKRGALGYDIHTQINTDNPKIKEFFDDKPIVTADTHINWFGWANVKAKVPNFVKNKGNFQIDWSGADVNFKVKKEEKQFLFKDILFKIPKITARNDHQNYSINNIIYSIDQSYSKKLSDSKSEFSIDSIQFDKYSINKVNYTLGFSENKNFFDINQTLSVKDGTVGKYQLNQLALNSNIKDIAKSELQHLFDVANHEGEICHTSQEVTNNLLDATLPVLSKGFKFDSKNNILEINNQKLTLEADGALSTSANLTRNDLIKDLRKNLAVNYQLNVDKGLIRLIKPEITDQQIREIALKQNATVTETNVQIKGTFK